MYEQTIFSIAKCDNFRYQMHFDVFWNTQQIFTYKKVHQKCFPLHKIIQPCES